MERLLRSLFLRMAKDQVANRIAKRYGLRLGADRFVSGETVESAIIAIRTLQDRGMVATVDHLGEFVRDASEARESAAHCVAILDAIRASDVPATLSVKLTQLGLDIERGLCESNMRLILNEAQAYGIMVTIDMEDSAHCKATLQMYRTLRLEFDNVGTVIQAYLRRSFEDVLSLSQVGAHLRIVKGAYKEPPEVAFPDKGDVDANYVQLIEAQLLGPGFCAIATHDPVMIETAKRFIAKYHISSEKYEFQMLYGIGVQLQEQLVAEGYPVRIYVPFGTDWFGYFMRRLAERPANVGFVWRGLRK